MQYSLRFRERVSQLGSSLPFHVHVAVYSLEVENTDKQDIYVSYEFVNKTIQ